MRLLIFAPFLHQAAASLGLNPRTAWLRSYTSRTLPLLPNMTAAQLAAVAAAVGQLDQTSVKADELARGNSSWVKAWTSCSIKQLEAAAGGEAVAASDVGRMATAGLVLGVTDVSLVTSAGDAEAPGSSSGAEGGDGAADTASGGVGVGRGGSSSSGKQWVNALLAAARATAAAAAAAKDAAARRENEKEKQQEEDQQSEAEPPLEQEETLTLTLTTATAADLVNVLTQIRWEDQQERGTAAEVVAALAVAAGGSLTGCSARTLTSLVEGLLEWDLNPGERGAGVGGGGVGCRGWVWVWVWGVGCVGKQSFVIEQFGPWHFCCGVPWNVIAIVEGGTGIVGRRQESYQGRGIGTWENGILFAGGIKEQTGLWRSV